MPIQQNLPPPVLLLSDFADGAGAYLKVAANILTVNSVKYWVEIGGKIRIQHLRRSVKSQLSCGISLIITGILVHVFCSSLEPPLNLLLFLTVLMLIQSL